MTRTRTRTGTWTDTDKDTANDKDMDTDMDMDTDTDVDITFSKISIWGYCHYSAIWITCDTSLHKFQQRYKLAALLPDENYVMQI